MVMPDRSFFLEVSESVSCSIAGCFPASETLSATAFALTGEIAPDPACAICYWGKAVQTRQTVSMSADIQTLNRSF